MRLDERHIVVLQIFGAFSLFCGVAFMARSAGGISIGKDPRLCNMGGYGYIGLSEGLKAYPDGMLIARCAAGPGRPQDERPGLPNAGDVMPH